MRVLLTPLMLLVAVLSACDLGTAPVHPFDVAGEPAGTDSVALDADASPEAAEDSAAGEEVVEQPPPPGDAPTAELLVKIVSPSAIGSAATPGSRVVVMGVAFGQVSGVEWSVTSALQPTASRSGTVASSNLTFWATDAIDLDAGDNFVTVTAHDDTGATVSDRIVITYNQGFVLPGRVVARPPTIFDGEKQDIHASIALGLFGGGTGLSLWLEQVDQDGVKVGSTDWQMLDDGLVASSGDQIQSDGEFTRRVNLTCQPGKPIWLRAHVQGLGYDGKPLNVRSALTRIDCLARVTRNGVLLHQKALVNARKAYDAALPQGTGAARTAAIAVLQADANGAEVAGATDPGGLWIRWKDDVLGALSEPVAGNRGGQGEAAPTTGLASVQSDLTTTDTFNADSLGTRTALFLTPFASEFGANDEVKAAAAVVRANPCPPFVIDGPFEADDASLDRFRSWGDYGLVALATHGEVYFKKLSAAAKAARFWPHPGSQEVLWTGETVDVTRLAEQGASCTQDADCAGYGGRCVITVAKYEANGTTTISGVCHDDTGADLVAGRVVLGDRTWGITPEFLLHYGTASKGANGLVYLGACRTMWNGTLLAALYGAGARAVAGYSNVVTGKFAGATGATFLQRVLGDGMSAGAAWGVGEQDPDHHGSFFKLFGDRQLSVPLDPLLNAGFETGDLTAWQKDGDGRVIARLGATKPVSGKFMGIISTGLGFTQKIGSIQQPVCIPAGTNRLTFWWKYFSEEFRAGGGWCGGGFQDPFTASLVEADGTEHKMVAVHVDDFCGPKDKTCASKTPSLCGGFWKVCQSDGTRCGPFGSPCKAGDADCVDATWGLNPGDPGLKPAYAGTDGTTLLAFDQGPYVYTIDWQLASYDVTALAGKGPLTLKLFNTDTGDTVYDTAILLDTFRME